VLEYGSTWTITAADGTSVSFNDGGVFILDDVTGFDSPNVRQSIAELPEADGAVAGNFYFGARPVTMRGQIYAGTAALRNAAVVQLQRALRGLRSNVTLYSQASGLPAMQAEARLDNLRVTGGYVKQFQIALICPDPRMYSQALNDESGVGSVATSGAPFPLDFPIPFGGGTGAVTTVNATNAGNFPALPVIRVTGPASDPHVTNLTTGQEFWLDDVSLADSSAWVEVDAAAHTVTDQSGTNLYSSLRFPDSDWIDLIPGANELELRHADTGTTAVLTVTWRDAWV
jgi:hypothetical protein